MQDSKFNIWIANYLGVTKYDSRNFNNFRQTIISNKLIYEIIEDNTGRIWFVDWQHNLYYYENKKIYEYEHNNIILKFSSEIFEIDIDSIDSVYIKLSNGNIYHINNKCTLVSSNDTECLTVNRNYINYKLSTSNYNKKPIEFGNYKLLTKSNELTVVSNNGQYYVKKFKSDILWVFVDSNKLLYVGLKEAGLKIFCDIKQEKATYSFLENQSISSCVVDTQNGLWVTSLESGLSYFPNIQIKAVNEHHGLISSNVNRICKSPYGIVIPNNNLDYQFFDSHKFTTIENKQNFIFSKCSGLKFFDDKLFVGYYDNNGGSKSFIIEDEKIVWEDNLDFFDFLKKEQDYYLIGRRVLRHIKNYKLIREDIADDYIKVFDVCQNTDSTMLLAANNGLFIYNFQNFEFEQIVLKNYRLNSTVNRIRIKDDVCFIATKSEGLIIVLDRFANLFSEKNGLASNNISDIHIEGDVLWIAGNKGLTRLSLKDYSYRVFNTENGLISNEIYDIETYEDKVYLSTDKGICYFNKDIELEAFPIRLDKITINKKEISADDNIILNEEKDILQVSFKSYLYATKSDKLLYYKLEGHDKNWKKTKNDYIDFSFLPSGKYKLLVYSENQNGNRSQIIELVNIIVKKEYFSIILFHIILIAIIAAITFLAFYLTTTIRVSEMRKKMEATKRINYYHQQALAAQINPHFIFNSLNSIQNYIIKNDQKKSREYLSKFGVLMRKVLYNSQSAIISLDEELKALDLYIGMELIRFRNNFKYVLQVDEDVDLNQIKLPPMILQPIVENAIHHGLMPKEENRKLEINIRKLLSNVEIIITDNGIGRLKSQELKRISKTKNNSLGIKITENRIKLFSEMYKSEMYFEIIDMIDSNNIAIGTSIKLTIKLNSDG
ncbi:MAG: histidine kinase [Marinifilaceae bacterium]|nr:histidine kinase [Marinifilaceae bacterium]